MSSRFGLATGSLLALIEFCPATHGPAAQDWTTQLTISDTLIAVGPQGTTVDVRTGIAAPGPILELRAALAAPTRCDPETAHVLTDAGLATLHATVVTRDGRRHELPNVWPAGAPCEEVVFETELFVDSARVLASIELSADRSVPVARLRWASGARPPMKLRFIDW
jgi:hypothetical protein